MGYARYVDRIWALAVALGIGGDIFKTCGWGHFRRPPLRLIRVRWA